MKKLITAVALVATIGFFGIQQASAQRGMGAGMGNPDCWRANQQNVQVLDEESQKARTAFFDATTELRKDMFMKRAEMRAIMHGDNPDEKKAAALAGEMFELRTQIQAKADEAGWKGGMGGGAGTWTSTGWTPLKASLARAARRGNRPAPTPGRAANRSGRGGGSCPVPSHQNDQPRSTSAFQ